MAVFKKKFKTKERSDFQRQEEDRVPNHWAYNDDPILNLEPVFSDSPDKPAPSIEQIAREYLPEIDDSATTHEVSNKLQELRARIGKSAEPEIKGPLGSIISGARQKSTILQNEILENDPVIAKLAKIEELKRTGGVDSNLYTDLSKSDKTMSYAQRAKEFHSKNITKKHFETEIQRKLRLSREAQERRESMANSLSTPETELEKARQKAQDAQEKREADEANVYLAKKKKSAKLEELEYTIKDRIMVLKDLRSQKLEKETELSILEIETKTFVDEAEREHFLEDKLKEIEIFINSSRNKVTPTDDSILIPRRRSTKTSNTKSKEPGLITSRRKTK
ncbi:hypothetical protein [Spiroplasma culicicola]|uniref:Uncharacterized protein n=1 Tax=Spiroplasma culicicola AES-1 TaxID=1276246 RepID=W6A7Y7_9MOLU|nr:hypothetical protein [Spiroplasma culicicola]AHI53233.1 hypothetical protein SCULI_v1c08930 [Spiroplasma culicicola AES-1]